MITSTACLQHSACSLHVIMGCCLYDLLTSPALAVGKSNQASEAAPKHARATAAAWCEGQVPAPQEPNPLHPPEPSQPHHSQPSQRPSPSQQAPPRPQALSQLQPGPSQQAPQQLLARLPAQQQPQQQQSQAPGPSQPAAHPQGALQQQQQRPVVLQRRQVGSAIRPQQPQARQGPPLQQQPDPARQGPCHPPEQQQEAGHTGATGSRAPPASASHRQQPCGDLGQGLSHAQAAARGLQQQQPAQPLRGAGLQVRHACCRSAVTGQDQHCCMQYSTSASPCKHAAHA